MEFYRRQVVAQQQLLQLKREELMNKQKAAFGSPPDGSNTTRHEVFAQLVQVRLGGNMLYSK